MTMWIDDAREVLGSEFDELLIQSGRVWQILQGIMKKQDPERLESQMSFYLDGPYADRPARVFSFPQKPPKWTTAYERPYSDGHFRVYSFPSGYKVRNPALRDHYRSFQANRTGYLVHWTHGDKGRKTILACHGFAMGEPRRAETMFRVSRLFSLGLDVALYITPFHWRRAETFGARFTPPFPFADPVVGLEGFGQAMHELTGSVLMLKEMGASQIGLIGASLGGYLAGLFVSLKKMVDFVTLVVPLVSFMSLKKRAPAPAPGKHRKALERLQPDVEALWKIHTPLSHACKLPPEKCLIIAMRGDRICSFEDVQKLYEHWGKPHHMFIRGGHSFFFPRSARGEAWYRFLDEQGFT